MSAPAEATKTTGDGGAESPTTARPLEMDDDDVQETSVLGEDGGQTTVSTADKTSTTTSETAPQQPPRPAAGLKPDEMILKEAFPSVDDGVIKAVLRASGGQVEPAFNALLEMTDPDAAKGEPQDVPPPQPPRPQGRPQMSQLEADELYARQLAEQYENAGAYEARTSSRQYGGQQRRGQGGWQGEDREHSFLDDDLPIIRENLRKGFEDTQTTVNSWISTIRKKIEDNFDESPEPEHGPSGHYGRPTEPSRRSGDYDADPQVLSDDFAGMKFSSDGTPSHYPRTSSYRSPPPTSASPRPGEGRRVGFKEETEEINMYDSSPKVPPKDTPPTSGAKASKWQPLSSVDPNPIADNDPFSLGDSEDEKDTKDKDSKPKDATSDENERLKQAAAEAMADSLVEPAKGDGEPAKKS